MKNYIPVSCAVIQNDGRFFVVQRKKEKKHGGSWEFPGGKVKFNETEQACLSRELWEELNLKVNVVSDFEPVYHHYDNFKIKLIPFLCTLRSGSYKLLEHEQAGWFSLNKLYELNMTAADKRILEQIKKAGY